MNFETECLHMKKSFILILLLCLTLGLSGCRLIVKDQAVDDKRAIVTVNGESVDKKTFTGLYNQSLNQAYQMQQLYQQFGMQAQPVDPATILTQTVEGAVRDLVIKQKTLELGLDKLSADQQKTLEDMTEKNYQDMLKQVKDYYFKDTELKAEELDKAVIAKAEEIGQTRENIGLQAAETDRLERLKAEATKDVVVTDEEVKADYDKKVEDAKKSYESDKSAYGQSVNGGQTVYYAPAGYRYIKQVLIKFAQADQDAMAALQKEMEPLNTALTQAQAELSANDTSLQNAGLSDADKQALLDKGVTLKQAVDAAQGAVDAKQKELDAKKEAAYAAITPKAQEVFAKATAEQKDFNALIEVYNEDKGMPKSGYAVCEGFAGFDEAFVKPAMALKAVGEVSEPSRGIYGFYITQYAADIAEGPVAFDSVKDGIKSAMTEAKKNASYEESVAKWIAEAKVETFAERMNEK